MKSLHCSHIAWVIFALLLVHINSCTPYSQRSNHRMSQIELGDPPWVVYFKKNLGHHWYEVKYADVSVGWARKEKRIRMESGTPVFQFHQSEELRLHILGESNVINVNETRTFSSDPPYPLLSYSYVKYSVENMRSLSINRIDAGKYEIITSHNNRRKSQTMENSFYTMEDELELEMWVQTAPEITDYESFSKIGSTMPEIGIIKTTVQDVRYEYIDGGKRKIFEISAGSDEHGVDRFEFDEKGGVRFMTDSGQFHYYIREQKPLLPSGEPVDLYVHSMVPITQKIGKVDKIKRLHLILRGPNAELLETAPGQRVIHTVYDGYSLVIIGYGSPGVTRTKTHQEDVSRYSKATPRIKSDHPDIIKMAKEAVGGTILTVERIEKLVEFVNDYISYGYVFETDLIDLVRDKKGDCSEYALLFAALARSLRIPCRVVAGLVYLGDWCQGFGMHAWNEVVVDGYWTAVDASDRANIIDPIYIRFPEDPFKHNLLLESVHQMSIDIEKVERTD